MTANRAPCGSVKHTVSLLNVGDKLVGLTYNQRQTHAYAARRMQMKTKSRQVGDQSYQLTRTA